MLDDPGLAAPGDEDQLLDPRLARLVDGVLDQRAVDHRQQLLGDDLGGGQEPRAETGDGKHGFTDRLGSHRWLSLLLEERPASTAHVPCAITQVNHRSLRVSASCTKGTFR